MAQGKVTVTTLNQVQGELSTVEKHFLFIGVGASNIDSVISLNQQSDLDDLLGSADSDLKTNISAAMLNASTQWAATCVPISGTDWEAAIDLAIDAGISPEGIIVLIPVASESDVNDLYTKAVELLNTHSRRVFILGASAGIDAATQTWAQYQTEQLALVENVVGDRVGIVPQLHGNNLGVLAGRLANDTVSIADSPMRTATGALVDLGATPTDSDGKALTNATLSALDAGKLSVPQLYVDYPGTYWGDCNLLDIPGGDYTVIENLRVADKAARAVRLLSIARVANRLLNDTEISIENNKTYFTRPLREMSRGTMFDGIYYPAELQPPEDDAVSITWPSQTKVIIYLKLKPYNSPKTINNNIVLDLSGGDL